jgi:hypothetical protein
MRMSNEVGGPFGRTTVWEVDMAEPDWTPAEPEEILDSFRGMLAAATGDGAKKRAAGEKVSWKVDPGHEAALFSHLNKWKHGELVDKDSGAHPLVHLAWRALAIAYQESQQYDAGLGDWYPPGR